MRARRAELSDDAVAQAAAAAAVARGARQAARDAAAYLRTLELLTGGLVELAKLRAESRRASRASAPRAERLATCLEHAILNQLAPACTPRPPAGSPGELPAARIAAT